MTVIAQKIAFFGGMFVRSWSEIWYLLTRAPTNQVIPHGKMRKPAAQGNFYYFWVKSFKYGFLSLANIRTTSIHATRPSQDS